jgi:hypothetical protein
MSPSREFYNKLENPTPENEKIKAEFAAASFPDEPYHFLVEVKGKKTGQNPTTFYGFISLGLSQKGDGILHIPIHPSLVNENEKKLKNLFLKNKESVKNLDTNQSFNLIAGINFHERMGDIKASSMGDQNSFDLTLARNVPIEHWRRLPFDIDEQPLIDSAIGFAKHLEDTFDDFSISPLPFKETVKKFRQI